MKTTAIAPSNIAFIKYWGKKDEKLKLPLNGSISVNLSGLSTITTTEFSKKYEKDEVIINGKQKKIMSEKVIKYLDLIRNKAKIKIKAKVVSQNNFPTASGLASSASGFAALSLSATKAAGLDLSEKELTIIARQGSGSACRSIPDGWVEWIEGDSNKNSYAYSIFPENHWNISIISAIINYGEKKVKSTEGMRLVLENPFLKLRLKRIKQKIEKLKKYIELKKFTAFGELIEKEALELHAMILTSSSPIIYWEPMTIKLMKLIQQWRKEGLECYFTIDAGPHLKIIIEDKNKQKILNKLSTIQGLANLIVNKPCKGTQTSEEHLF